MFIVYICILTRLSVAAIRLLDFWHNLKKSLISSIKLFYSWKSAEMYLWVTMQHLKTSWHCHFTIWVENWEHSTCVQCTLSQLTSTIDAIKQNGGTYLQTQQWKGNIFLATGFVKGRKEERQQCINKPSASQIACGFTNGKNCGCRKLRNVST